MKITAYLPAAILKLFLNGESINISNFTQQYGHNTIRVEFDREETEITVRGDSIFVQIPKWED